MLTKGAAPTPIANFPPKPSDDAGNRWPVRRAAVKQAWLDLMGPFPQAMPPPCETQVNYVETVDGIRRYRVVFRTEPDSSDTWANTDANKFVYAWMLMPLSVVNDYHASQPEARKKAPAIICLHSTTYGAGKSSSAGLAGRYVADPALGFVGRPDLLNDPSYQDDLPGDPALGRGSGLVLAKQGYVTLCVDLLSDGERIVPGQRPLDTRAFYKRFGDPRAASAWSMMGKNVWDVSRAVDFLQNYSYVDPDQIGITGWSHGAHIALFAAAFDDRIKATVTNGAVLDWHRTSPTWCREPSSWEPWMLGDPIPAGTGSETWRRWGFTSNSGPYIYLPKFRPYHRDPTLPLPVDFDSLMMMVAPRALLIISSEIEFNQHNILPKCMEALKVYQAWDDAAALAANPPLPSAFQARKARTGYQHTQDYYERNNGYSASATDNRLKAIKAGDCFSWFSFPGGHSYPPTAQVLTTGWFDRWLGRVPPAPVPSLPNIPWDEAFHIGPGPKPPAPPS